jgi:hypothetical protein
MFLNKNKKLLLKTILDLNWTCSLQQGKVRSKDNLSLSHFDLTAIDRDSRLRFSLHSIDLEISP